jgi:hypothetical protein
MAETARFRQKLQESADALGMPATELAAIISYETGGTFSPTKRGPTTKWGQHQGLIQFGKPQAKRYGADFSSAEAALESQLGPDGAVVKYFRASGWKPGMSLMNAYSIVNAGGPNRFNASDTAAGGAPGTVRDKVQNQFAGHIAKAEKLMGGKVELTDLSDFGGGPRGQNEDAYPERNALSDKYQVSSGQAENIYRAYINGEMTADEAQAYEADVMAGRMSIPDVSIYEKSVTPEQEASIYSAYSDGRMSDDEAQEYERDIAMGKISYPLEAPPVEAAPQATGQPTAPAEDPSLLDQAKRGFGLGTRAVGQGLASIGGIIYDPIAATMNMATGTQIPPLREQASTAMTGMGLPTPQTGAERVMSAAQEGAAGAIGGVGAAPVLAKAGGVVGNAAATMMGAGPVSQVAGGLGAGAAGQTAQEMGAGPIGQTAAALAGGMAGGIAANRFDSPQPQATALARVEPPVTNAPKAVAALPAPELPPESLGELVRKASTNGMGSAKAAAELAKVARVDPEALAAAQRLGIDVPADVFADNQMIKEAVGLTRSVAGSEASAQWRETVLKAAQKADDVMDAIDGAPDLASISDKVQRSLTASRDGLQQQADILYAKVDKAVPPETLAETSNMVSYLNKTMKFLGGKNGLTAEERELYDFVTDPDQAPTYYAMIRKKVALGDGYKGKGPYKDINSSILDSLYGAISEDQLATVAKSGLDDAVGVLKIANALHGKKAELNKRIVSAFGKDLEGSVASKLRTAVTQASKGDAANLNRILQVVPENLQREAVVTALSAMSRTGQSALGSIDGAGFGFAEYAKLYRGLRQNAPIYAKIAKVVGPETSATMRDMYEVSRRITDARANVLTTGKANQGLVQSMLAEGIVARVLNSSVGRTGRGGAGAAVGAAALGPIGGMMGMAAAAGKIGKDRTEAVSALFRSPKFQSMLAEAATKSQPSAATIKAVRNSQEFNRWAKINNIADPSKWLFGVLSGTQAAQNEGE